MMVPVCLSVFVLHFPMPNWYHRLYHRLNISTWYHDIVSLHVSTLGPSTPCFASLHLSLLKRAEPQRRSKNEHSKQLRNANPLRSLEDFQVERVPASLRSSGYPMGLTMDCRLLGFNRFRGYDMMCKSISGSLQYIQGITQLSELLPCWQGLAAIEVGKLTSPKMSTRRPRYFVSDKASTICFRCEASSFVSFSWKSFDLESWVISGS